MGDLLESFDFRVIDADAPGSLKTCGTSGLFRSFQEHQGTFEIWVYGVSDVSRTIRNKVYIYFAHDATRYSGRTPDERESLGRHVSYIACFFVHGLAAGWNTVARDVNRDGDIRDEIDLNHYLPHGRFDEIREGLRLSDLDMRDRCGEDLNAYAVQRFREKGAMHDIWTCEDFQNSGFAR